MFFNEADTLESRAIQSYERVYIHNVLGGMPYWLSLDLMVIESIEGVTAVNVN